MRILDIIEGTSVDGPGLRTAIYFAGCLHECPGCHNPQSWPMDAGKEMSADQLIEITEEADADVTLTGGDPVYQAAEIMPLCRELKRKGRNVWLYTGFRYEELMAVKVSRELLDYIDVLVDGPFIERLHDRSLLFRGSSNQRLVDVKRSMPGRIVEWQSDF